MTTQQDRAELIAALKERAEWDKSMGREEGPALMLQAAALLAADARGGEAVGWTTPFDLDGATSGFIKTLVCRPMSVKPSFPEHQVIYIYTRPQPERVPLTDEQIHRTYQELWPFHPHEEPTLAKDMITFARAIEAAHHIGKPAPVGPLEDEHGVVAGKETS